MSDDFLKEMGLDSPVQPPPVHDEKPKIVLSDYIEEKTKCPFCKEEIQPDAQKCRYCHEILNYEERARRERANQPAKWNRGAAVILSVVLPGAGDIYKGHIVGGVIWMPLTILAYVAFFPAGIVMHLIALASAASGDPRA